MPPIRRYLRITKYSVLEVRIYLDQPALAHSWFLNPRKPVLPRVIEAIRPLVLPKLREENERERSRAKGKKKGVKDVVIEDDFEVSIFLTETSTRHSLLTKQKHFHDINAKTPNAGATTDTAIEVSEGPSIETDVQVLSEDADDDMARFHDIPAAEAIDVEKPTNQRRRSKRRRVAGSDEDEGVESLFVDHDDTDGLEDDTQLTGNGGKSSRTVREEGYEDDKKKMAMNTSYDGFAIYGRVLCLVIKKRDAGRGRRAAGSGGQVMVEEWIASTQMPIAVDENEA